MFSTTNIIMYGTPILLAGALWFWLPRKQGEVRPSTQFLMIGAPLLVLSVYGLWRQINVGESIQVLFALVFSALSAGMVAYWFRERLYFKRALIFRFVWNQLTGMIAYRDIHKVVLTDDGLQMCMKNGTYWKIPGMGEPEQAEDIISSLARAGVQLPSYEALQNRFGIGVK